MNDDFGVYPESTQKLDFDKFNCLQPLIFQLFLNIGSQKPNVRFHDHEQMSRKLILVSKVFIHRNYEKVALVKAVFITHDYII